MSDLPRSEYPRPQFVRDKWLCLNGQWSFQRDKSDSGLERGLLEADFDEQITVPFCPESKLSGIGDVDFQNAVWYRRVVEIPADWTGSDVWLSFQAVDYDASVWADGELVATHRGGWTPFSCNLGQRAGQSFTLTVRARDDHRLPTPKGKQSSRYGNSGCHYTRTTGIWQSVWAEPLAPLHIKRPRITPDAANAAFYLSVPLSNAAGDATLEAELIDGDKTIDSQSVRASAMSANIKLSLNGATPRLWQPGDGQLYDIKLTLRDADGKVIDSVTSYCGLRDIAINGRKVMINGKCVFQRLVLDQGYYPDGILTAASEAELIKDIELSMAAGFNGARLHQKVFEERFLYHADRLGYMVWGEYGDWFTNLGHEQTVGQIRPFGPNYVAEWIEAVERDYSHPAIVGWCPLNETHHHASERVAQHSDCMHAMFLATKAADPTRVVLDVSGYSHRVAASDIYDSHDYQQDPKIFAENQSGLAEGKPFINSHGAIESLDYNGQPYFVSEFGGIRWNPDAESGSASWGYGEGPKTLEEFYERFEGLCNVLLDDSEMFGYCYTQLTDVFQEQNGIYTFDRREKFDTKRICKIQQREASYEK